MAEVRFYPTTIDKTTISAEDLLDIQIMKAGVNQFNSAKMRVDEFQSAATNFINFSRVFQAAEVQTLANAPIELLPASTNFTYHIIDPILIVRGLASGTDIQQNTIYSIKEAGNIIYLLEKNNFIEPLDFYHK